MPDRKQDISNKPASGSDKSARPDQRGGNPVQNAEKWSGGSKASKGPITQADKRNENSSAKS
jgi:hypothetical protein